MLGEIAKVDAATIEALRARFAGTLVTPDHEEYEQGRHVWNAMIDRRPAVIARPATVEDIVAVVDVARETGAPLAVRCGGHSIQGFSTCDGGIVLDMSTMRGVHVDVEARVARVEGGALISDVDQATQSHGLAAVMGTVSHTGVAGLTLGGGLGRLTPKFGLAVDNLLAVDVVTADGKILRASDDENPDLFWAIRGAGANFGVVTGLEFRLHEIGTEIGAGLNLYEIADAGAVLRRVRDVGASGPSDMIVVSALITVPPAPPFPPELHGRRMLLVAGNHFGDPAEAARELDVLSKLGTPAFSVSIRAPYLMVQKLSDEKYRWGQRYYVKGSLLRELDDSVIDTAVSAFATVPGPDCEIDFLYLGRAAARVPEDAMAYSGRSAEWFVGIDCTWNDPAEDDQHRAWTRATFDAMSPSFLATNYVNAVEEADAVGAIAAYGPEKYAKLRELKRRYDPSNVFRLNTNIEPA